MVFIMRALNVIKSAFNCHVLLLYSKPPFKMSKDGHNKGQKWYVPNRSRR